MTNPNIDRLRERIQGYPCERLNRTGRSCSQAYADGDYEVARCMRCTALALAADLDAAIRERDEARARLASIGGWEAYSNSWDAIERRASEAEAALAEAQREREEAVKRLEMIADADYRGNRSGESVAAHMFLVSIGRRT